ncbi:endonuclease/exonuclease/phosphatase (EEP) superfamily protein YafD [Streptomyces puniciscabiei]|uniref:Endonuclease/exonuclease/phosphatase (EEP) superfamily protein YafD n=1 Tax=Streptomyces puniciscabiei TaxID=164348 RepID=A0A542UFB3_9ACTN|nr:endonuclease/exonuclease/phosphatase family protein [Streptomyces puniciscabiei]TQK97743.1 endonuclease/exonuclease/phosphatase (EEP) superfamily protein YafD [Streptomyces puniciscabiei]
MNRSRVRGLGVWCAGLLLAGVGVVAGCRVAGTDGVTPVPQLLAFLPWLLVPAGLALLCALLARWWPGVLCGAVVLGVLAWYLQPYDGTTGPGGPPLATLRVLTSNLEFGRGTPALVPWIRALRPDVVFVEECEFTCQATLEADFATGYPYRQAVRAAGSHGSLILSRRPLRPTAGVPGTMGMPGAVADVHGHAVRLQLAHPMPPLPGQVDLWRRELGRLRAFAAADPAAPTVLAGDFNATRDHAAFRHILDTGLSDAARLAGDDRAASWPARTAAVVGTQIDHVLLSPDFTATGARFLPVAGSDHRALVVDLTLHDR